RRGRGAVRNLQGVDRAATLTSMSGTRLDAFDDSFDAMGQFTDTVAGDVRDPYPELAVKRRTTPVEVVDVVGFDGTESQVCNVFTYDLCAQVLRDNVTFSSSAIRDLMVIVMGPIVLGAIRRPEHNHHRLHDSAAFRQDAETAILGVAAQP